MNYNFREKRANEINANNELAKDEALNMKSAFKKQGDTKHGREMSHVYGQASINDRMFDLVVKEYFKLS
jgi:hypothetical protein|tara:strand:- start:3041 stop:3247 length:207 start_codon:yes stop_codon:yes gene_type:complete